MVQAIDANTTFMGTHDLPTVGKFDVFYSSSGAYGATGWYWWSISEGIKTGLPHGPFPTAEGAYLSACSD